LANFELVLFFFCSPLSLHHTEHFCIPKLTALRTGKKQFSAIYFVSIRNQQESIGKNPFLSHPNFHLYTLLHVAHRFIFSSHSYHSTVLSLAL